MQLADADRQIEFFFEQVDVSWREVKFQRNFGILRGKRRQHIGQEQGGEVARHRYAQATAGARLAVFAEGLDGIDFGGDLAGVFEQLLAEFGQRQATGGAQDQPLAQALFEQGDAARDGGFGQADPFGGTTEAARLGDTGEDQQVFGVVLFHDRDNDSRIGLLSECFRSNRIALAVFPPCFTLLD